MSDPVRDIVERFGDWWGKVKGWRKLGIGSLVLILFSLFLFVALVCLTIWTIKGLSVGGFRNRDLYIPRMRRRM